MTGRARLSRRAFLKWCALAAAGLGLGCPNQAPPALAREPQPRVRFPVHIQGYPRPPAPYYDGSFGYGISTVYAHVEPRVADLGFGYQKWCIQWAEFEPQPGVYKWSSGDHRLRQAAADCVYRGIRVLIRVDTPPAWAAPGTGSRPPSSAADYGRFMGALAAHMRGTVAAYELWNEPNLSGEWGNAPPDPARYASLLQASYASIKAADASALVLSAGLATTGGDGGITALDDCVFLERMYAAGARPHFDALGSHPYGFANPPETRNANGVTDFRRAEDQRAVMLRHGDGAKKIWATEFGWLIDPTAYGHPEYLNDPLWAGRQWQRVSPQTQADYLVRAYQYARANWPWMAAMFLFNLDFSIAPWHPPAEPMRWYAIVDGYDAQPYAPRPAYAALKAMPK